MFDATDVTKNSAYFVLKFKPNGSTAAVLM